jgi:hypothetical protein
MSKIDGGLRSLFHKNIKGVWTAIETGETSRGVPDSNYLFEGGIEGWIEFKQTATNKIKRTTSWPFQIGWHMRRARYGGRSFIAVRQCDDNLWIIPGAAARDLDEYGLNYLRLPCISLLAAYHVVAVFHGGPKLWNWNHIANFISSDKEPFYATAPNISTPARAKGIAARRTSCKKSQSGRRRRQR